MIEQPERIDQKQFLVGVQAGGDLSAEPLCPAVQVEEPKRGRQLAAQDLLAFGVAHRLDAPDVVDRQHAVRALEEAADAGRGHANHVRQLLQEARRAVATVRVDDPLQLLAE